MALFRQRAKQTNYGYFEVEADSLEEAELKLAELIEDDLERQTSDWVVETPYEVTDPDEIPDELD